MKYTVVEIIQVQHWHSRNTLDVWVDVWGWKYPIIFSVLTVSSNSLLKNKNHNHYISYRLYQSTLPWPFTNRKYVKQVL